MARRTLLMLVVIALTCAGCGAEPPAAARAPEQPPPVESPALFDVTDCGTITGLIAWNGPVPDVKPATRAVPRADGTGHDNLPVALANAPRIDTFTRGMAGAVVYLREVNPSRARQWDLPPVEVAFENDQLLVKQGDRVGRTGFVRRGEAVSFRSREARFHSLRARGAAFFALPFPDPDAPLARTFDTCGRVELTSAAGSYWQAADLFVCDHPYYTVTDADGRYRFTHVPAGNYDLVAWHPNWEYTGTERSPETTLPVRLLFKPPLQSSRRALVERGRTTLATLSLP